MKIACITTYDPVVASGFSVHCYHQTRSLKKQSIDIEYIYLSPNLLFSSLLKMKSYYYTLLDQAFSPDRNRRLLQYYAESRNYDW